MKKIIILAFLSLSVATVKAQTQTDKPKYTYCELLIQPRPFSTKVNITVDYGQETKIFQDTRMKDEETGRLKKFNSIVDALNYMSEQGWDYIQSYNLNTSTNTLSAFETHWVLRKEITK